VTADHVMTLSDIKELISLSITTAKEIKRILLETICENNDDVTTLSINDDFPTKEVSFETFKTFLLQLNVFLKAEVMSPTKAIIEQTKKAQEDPEAQKLLDMKMQEAYKTAAGCEVMT